MAGSCQLPDERTFYAFFSPISGVKSDLPRGRLDDFWKLLLGPFFKMLFTGWPRLLVTWPSLRKGRRHSARDEAVQLVQTPASVHRPVPAGSPNPGAAHQPGVPERHAAEMDPHVSSQTFLRLAGRPGSHTRANEATEEAGRRLIFWMPLCLLPTGSCQSLAQPPVTAFMAGRCPWWEDQEGIRLSKYYPTGFKILCKNSATPKLLFNAVVFEAILGGSNLPSR